MNPETNPMNQHDCCQPAVADTAGSADSKNRLGRLSVPVAVGSAVLSSACCWLALLLLAFGVSAGGVAGFFERVRPFFLGATAIFLGAGFYFVYFRKPACKPGDACAVPKPKLQRFNRSMLWVATVVVIAFSLFPSYSPSLIRWFDGPSRTARPSDAAGFVAKVYAIQGMTCEACSARLETRLRDLPGVHSASVSFANSRASLVIDPLQFEENAVAKAVASAGYQVVPSGSSSNAVTRSGR